MVAGAAAIGVGGGLISGALNYAYSKKLQKRGFDFSEMMYNERYQRTVADMKLAGINPIMAAQSGLGGGGSPSGGSGSSINTPNIGEGAARAMKMRTEMDSIRANTALADANRGLAGATQYKHRQEGLRDVEQAKYYQAETLAAQAREGKIRTEERLLAYGENEARTRSEMEGSTWGKNLTRFEKGARKILGPLGGLLGGAAGAFIGAKARKPTVINTGPRGVGRPFEPNRGGGRRR